MQQIFKDNSLGVDLADIQLIRKFDKGIQYLLCDINMIMCRSWKDKTKVSIASAFQIILDSSKGKPNKIWVNQGSEFCIS